MVGTADRLKI